MLALLICVVLLWFVMPALLLLVGKMAKSFTTPRPNRLLGFPSDPAALARKQRLAGRPRQP